MKRLEQSVNANIIWCVNNTNGSQFLCPKAPICTSDYNFCPYASITCNSLAPFKCGNGTCVSNPTVQCCPPVNNQTQVWCPHLNSCVNSTNSTSLCCSLNSSTPIYCSVTKTCVAHTYDCCGLNSMVKCGFENKCAPANSSAFCFQPYNRSCSGDFPYQCPNDGTCKRQAADCSSPRVCPFGYTTCPDYSCIPGVSSISSCPKLPTCIVPGVPVTLARCSDGLTCTENLDKCPTQVTCPNGQIVCPDNTCAKSEMQCVQPFSSTPPKLSTCGLNMVRCPDGECDLNCTNHVARVNCTQLGMIQCPRTFQCASSYNNCASDVYCPLATNSTYSPSSVMCSEGPNICTWDAFMCRKQSCFSPLNYFNLSAAVMLPWSNYNTAQMMTCPDGRCNPQTSNCMTEISCSSAFIKGQSAGPYCHNSTTEADYIAQLAFSLQALTCPPNMIVCLSGHCRANVYECPQATTCPPGFPIQCQDGQCVSTRQSCLNVDNLVTKAVRSCFSSSLLLCQSDLQSCVAQSELCPTMSTCPMGYSKCSENQCTINANCPVQPSVCTTITPFYCRSTGTCVTNQTQCASLTTCPKNYPVKCASDQSCQSSISQCPTPGNQVAVVKTVSNQISFSTVQGCNSTDYFPCQDGTCQTRCPEWFNCTLSTDIQCENGLCVTNAQQCSSSNGCPFFAPYLCNYTAQCVSNISQCANQTTSLVSLTKFCVANFGNLTTACPSGSCVSANQSCPVILDSSCSRYLYPNMVDQTKCFVPQCPQTLPFKCDSGLCVSHQKFCPIIPYSASQINTCLTLSNLTQQNIPVPCGDGSCAARSDLCPPLYNCSLNLNKTGLNNNNLTVRCNDGTCRSSLMQCPLLNQTCSYRCPNGMCVANSSLCLLDNGCTVAAPNRCELNGLCLTSGQSCNGTFTLMQNLQFNVSRTNSICRSRGEVTCINGDMKYCVKSASLCINLDNGCSVTAPILCGGKCVSSYLKCATGYLPTNNNKACNSTSPFRCSNLNIQSCAALPFSTNSNLFASVCSAKTFSLVGLFPLNKCTSSQTPISCGDGSCVQNSGECRTCNYFCTAMMQCTYSQQECSVYASNQSVAFINVAQQCPEGVPIRCIVSGQCVSSIIECKESQIAPNKTYISNLIDLTCPTQSPVRCINGKCVNATVYCLSPASMNSTQMNNPIQWYQAQQNTPCQVYCSDGSCRDRQQNCPLIQACSSPLASFRCRSGFCSQNLTTCAFVYGSSELESATGFSTYCQALLGQNSTQKFFRCEDGTCRPAIFSNASQTYTNTCLTYFGCPLSAPLQCPTGQCVQTQTQCLNYSNPFCNGTYMCKNMMCVQDPSECGLDQSQIHFTQHAIDFNPLVQNVLSFAFSNNLIVGNITLHSGAISVPLVNITLAQSISQRIIFYPVPGQSSLNSSVLLNSTSYISGYYNITNQTLPLVDSLLFPMFEIKLLSSAQTVFNYNASLSFVLNLPTSFNLPSDVCLASPDITNGSLTCVSRNITQQGLSVSLPISGPGVYGVIFSPDLALRTIPIVPPQPTNPTEPTTTTPDCNWFCRHRKLVIISYYLNGVGVLWTIVSCLLYFCWWKKRPKKAVESDAVEETLVVKKPDSDLPSTVIKYEKANPVETLPAEELSAQKRITLNDSSSDDEEKKRTRAEETRMRQQIEKKLKLQVDEELRKEREQFQKTLEVKEQEIKNLQTSIKDTSGRDKSDSPDSRQPYSSARQKEDLKTAEAKMREHFQNEVNRISRELLLKAEEEKNAPPRKFTRYSKDSSIRSYTTGSNYGSVPAETKPPKLEMRTQKSDSDLNEQWNVLMDEYPSTRTRPAQNEGELLQPSKQDKLSKGFASQKALDKNQNSLDPTGNGQLTSRGGGVETNYDQTFKSPSRRQR